VAEVGHIKNGKRLFMAVQAAEKVFVSFKLESANPGGHSSLPVKDNAIYHLAGALTRLAQFDFPVHLFDVTRANFERMAPLYGGQLGADMKTVVQNSNDLAVVARLSATPLFNALLRTTCVATMLSGGHAENALPQMATAVVNCRMLPVDQAAEVEQTLQAVVGNPKVRVTVMTPAKASVYPPMNPKVLSAVTAATVKSWPGIPVVPQMETGATRRALPSTARVTRACITSSRWRARMSWWVEEAQNVSKKSWLRLLAARYLRHLRFSVDKALASFRLGNIKGFFGCLRLGRKI
jgi:acetylornithine deacetylase/succinyl-diaminopimelate desuccinylase-like protein